MSDGKGEKVDHPAHYGGEGNPYETINVVEAWGLGFNLGNCVKHVSRAGKKGDALTDLRKAAWYLAREIGRLESSGDVPAAERACPPPAASPKAPPKVRAKAKIVASMPKVPDHVEAEILRDGLLKRLGAAGSMSGAEVRQAFGLGPMGPLPAWTRGPWFEARRDANNRVEALSLTQAGRDALEALQSRERLAAEGAASGN